MAKRQGLADLAAAAGVSLATVDRALNGREAVSATTRALILEAARRVGHPALVRLTGQVSRGSGPELRLGVMLHKQGQDFYKAFAETLNRTLTQIPGLRARLVLEFSGSQSPSDMANLMRAMAGRCDVLAATAVNHPEVTAAVEELRAEGVRVVALLSEFAPGARAGYLGLDNLKIGRVAGWVTTLSARAPGKVLLFVGGHRWHGHELREAGFRAYLREAAPHLQMLETVVNLETRHLTYETTLAALRRHDDLRGIYVAGGGMEGAIAALRVSRRPGEVAMVVPALTPDSRAGLADGFVTLVTDTPLDRLCRALFTGMAAMVESRAEFGQIFLPPDIHLPEGL
ncbi:MAG: LacI family DNA-binding transcriptional regulator [Gemmobacter sp.]|uniref:LacI family DNA-binding transcriptional regulator n=1 Tax=Gemmobacter sp. TaxID=1898957 RepID=UPI001A43D16B|nr:LacI family DNA-binding transcriptional regulator [Gemmobacter sp.]MBL8563509.1 LacI family DNA-binding transcriptional regulator [Gemmobacter sp.]